MNNMSTPESIIKWMREPEEGDNNLTLAYKKASLLEMAQHENKRRVSWIPSYEDKYVLTIWDIDKAESFIYYNKYKLNISPGILYVDEKHGQAILVLENEHIGGINAFGDGEMMDGQMIARVIRVAEIREKNSEVIFESDLSLRFIFADLMVHYNGQKFKRLAK